MDELLADVVTKNENGRDSNNASIGAHKEHVHVRPMIAMGKARIARAERQAI